MNTSSKQFQDLQDTRKKQADEAIQLVYNASYVKGILDIIFIY